MNNFIHKNGLNPCPYLIAVLLCCTSLLAHAQRQEFLLKGVVFKEGTVQRMGKVLVADLTNTALTSSDDLGTFQLQCAMGDTLLFRQKDYADKKVAITNQNTVMVYMQTNINLNQVDIKGLSKKQELQQVMGEYNSQGIYSNGKPSLGSTILSPLNGLYDLFGSGPKQARRFQRYASNEMEQTAVDRRFTRPLITRITGLKDDSLQTFVQSYKPSYEDIKAWNEYDLINYIRRSYTDFQKGTTRPADLPKLTPAPKQLIDTKPE